MKVKKAPCLSILGTGSDVGKSIVATALCRIFRNMGLRVAPFKAQNMSNNSYITPEGGEMGRAQVVQAEASGVAPHVDMNPVLLKPNTEIGSQVVLHGKPIGNRNAKDYYKSTDDLFEKSLESLDRLREEYDLIIMEGAGSCGEVNLRDRDFVNFRIANAVNAPVILVSDISRGGVFAQIIGTLEVIPEEDKKQVCGFLVNRFRGHAELFDEGIRYIEEKTDLPVFGLIPHFTDIEIDSEDGVALDSLTDKEYEIQEGKINIAVIRLPHISNFTDFAALERDPNVNLHYVFKLRDLTPYDIILLPGTKNTRGDLEWLKESGWSEKVISFSQQGGQVCGICGGFQMLGNTIDDPDGVEGDPGVTEGLALLDVDTVLERKKVTTRSLGTVIDTGEEVEGYEIHMGKTRLNQQAESLIHVNRQNELAVNYHDGAKNGDGTVFGSYFHGIFDRPEFKKRMLTTVRPDLALSENDTPNESVEDFKNRQYDQLAKHFEQHMDITKLCDLIGISPQNKV